MKMRKKYKSIEDIKSKYGLLFMSPWIIGFLLFFAVPILQSVWYSLSEVTLSSDGVLTDFIGIDFYKYILMEDPDFLSKNLPEAIVSMLYSLPIILLLSLVLAMVLNQEFKGRVFFRALYFMPVIIASGVVVKLLFMTADDDLTSSGVSNSLTGSMFSIEDVIGWLDMPDKIAIYVKNIINNIFDLLWNCGIQTVLFIAGLQSIPRSLYEASKVEGATKWEEFWFITFPMLGNVTQLVAAFTMIDLFSSNTNKIIERAYNQISAGIYDRTSAMLWTYFGVVAIILGAVLFVYNRFLLKRWS